MKAAPESLSPVLKGYRNLLSFKNRDRSDRRHYASRIAPFWCDCQDDCDRSSHLRGADVFWQLFLAGEISVPEHRKYHYRSGSRRRWSHQNANHAICNSCGGRDSEEKQRKILVRRLCRAGQSSVDTTGTSGADGKFNLHGIDSRPQTDLHRMQAPVMELVLIDFEHLRFASRGRSALVCR